MTERRRFRGWHFVVLVLGALLVVGVASWIWIGAVADRRWAEMRGRVEALHDEALARTGERPVLRGEAVPGRAFDDYDLAIAEANRIPDMTVLGEFVSRTSTADRAKTEAFLSAHSILLDHLARGAQRSIGARTIEWEKSSMVVGGLLDAQTVAHFAVSKARLLAEEGKISDAVAVLLDGLQFGRDFGENATLIGRLIAVAVSRVCLDELKTLVEADSLSEEDLANLERGLRSLDENYPGFGGILRNDVLHTGYAVQNPKSFEEVAELGQAPWGFGLGSRLMLADAVLWQDEMSARVVAAEGSSWREIEKVIEGVRQEAEQSWNPFVKMFSYSPRSVEAVLSHRVRLRLLRAAIGFRRHGRVPTFSDPFGADLLHARAGGVLKIWSVSHDGVDDGGRGSWDLRKDPDCVLELKE